MSNGREEYDLFSMIESVLKNKSMRPLVVLVLIVLFVVFFKPWATVGAGQRGVVLKFGAVQDVVLNEGIHLRVPIQEDIVLVDVQVQKAETDAVAASSDLQDVTSTVALNYYVIPDKANKVYQELGLEFKARIIDPAVSEVVKAVTAKYTAENLITKRPEVSAAMQEQLTKRLIKYNIAVDAFSIVSFNFSDTFVQAIESKQTAEQLALKASRDLERIKIEAEQTITRAKAETTSLKMQKEIISPNLLKLREIEANLKAIEKWDGHLPGVTGGAVPFIGVGGSSVK